MADEPAHLPLADFIAALRAELRAAAMAKDSQLQFNVGPATVEFTVEAGASATMANEATQKVTLVLTPVTASGDAWQVADEVRGRPK